MRRYVFKRASDILGRLIDNTLTNTTQINDFSIGSPIRVLYEAISLSVEELYIITRENIRQGVDEGVFQAFGFMRRKAQRASGVVTIYFHSPKLEAGIVPRGTTFSSTQTQYPQLYETLTDFYVPKGTNQVDVEAFCTIRGKFGNVPGMVIDQLRTGMVNIDRVANAQAFDTGVDEEPMEAQQARFHMFIESIGRATNVALEYAVRSVEGITGVYIDERTGYVRIYAHDRNGDLPTRLKDLAEIAIEDYRPAGIPVDILPVKKVSQDISIKVIVKKTVSNEAKFKRDIQSAIESYLNNLQTSQSLVLSNVPEVVRRVSPELIYDIIFIEPKENRTLESNQIIRSGVIKVTVERESRKEG